MVHEYCAVRMHSGWYHSALKRTLCAAPYQTRCVRLILSSPPITPGLEQGVAPCSNGFRFLMRTTLCLTRGSQGGWRGQIIGMTPCRASMRATYPIAVLAEQLPCFERPRHESPLTWSKRVI